MAADNIENIDCALDAIEEMTAKLHELADAGAKMGDELTRDMDRLGRDERFEAAMRMWRQFSKIGAATSLLHLHAMGARRNTNSLLSELPEEA